MRSNLELGRNKHGLSRTIPKSIQRQIRQNAGFGCVECGALLTDYEHVDPEFKDAIEHDPNKMTFLCKTCHWRVTSGYMSKNAVKKAMLSPFCKTVGFAKKY